MEKWMLIVVLLPFLLGATFNADSCSRENVQSAISKASSGDTVKVPAGSCTWSSGITIDKRISVIGSGKDSTTIIFSGGAFTIDHVAARVSGFTFQTSSDGTAITIYGQDWRIDHCRYRNLERTGSQGIFANPTGRNTVVPPKGLIDHCEVINGKVQTGTYASNFDTMSNSWIAPLDLGGDSAIYIEDSSFTLDYDGASNAIDSNRGGRYVVRFNKYMQTGTEAHSLQNCEERGTIKWEIYHNTFTSKTSSTWCGNLQRGGTGVIFGNDYTPDGEDYNYDICFDNIRTFRDIGGICGLCDGDSPWDGNVDSTGWPCRDQIGRGTDLFKWEREPEDHLPPPKQSSVPVYLWSNTDSGQLVYVDVLNSGGDHIKANRDYYDYAPVFNGKSGTGVGTLAQRPSSCTDGVGYWATDVGEWNGKQPGPDGQLYKCVSGKWEFYYIPYPYPHPLAGGEVPVCNPSCSGKECGPDQCGSTCGTCQPGQVCQSGQCVTQTADYHSAKEVIEAEDGVLASMQESSGYIFPTQANSGSASYTFKVSAGDYILEALVDSQASTGTDSFFVGLDQENPGHEIYYMFKLPLVDGFNWAEVNRWGAGSPEFDPMVWSLDGVHTFTFYGREAGTRLDKIRLVPQPCQPVSMDQLVSIIKDWRASTIDINQVMQSIQIWKNGC